MNKICKKCVCDDSISSLKLDLNGICQFCKIHDEMEKEYPLNEKSFSNLLEICKKIKIDGINKKYDCIVGVSGGKDSSYLLYLVKEKLGLRPLAVHYDNGFDSDASVSNILKVCDKKNDTSNSFDITVGQGATADYTFYFKVENMKMLDGDYDVSVSSKSISHFKNKKLPIEYWIALEPDSTITK